MCEPGNSAAQAACMPGRPAPGVGPAPSGIAVVKPASWTLGAPLQHASARCTLHAGGAGNVLLDVACTTPSERRNVVDHVPLLALDVHEKQLNELSSRPNPGAALNGVSVDEIVYGMTLGSIQAPPDGTRVAEFAS